MGCILSKKNSESNKKENMNGKNKKRKANSGEFTDIQSTGSGFGPQFGPHTVRIGLEGQDQPPHHSQTGDPSGAQQASASNQHGRYVAASPQQPHSQGKRAAVYEAPIAGSGITYTTKTINENTTLNPSQTREYDAPNPSPMNQNDQQGLLPSGQPPHQNQGGVYHMAPSSQNLARWSIHDVQSAQHDHRGSHPTTQPNKDEKRGSSPSKHPGQHDHSGSQPSTSNYEERGSHPLTHSSKHEQRGSHPLTHSSNDEQRLSHPSTHSSKHEQRGSHHATQPTTCEQRGSHHSTQPTTCEQRGSHHSTQPTTHEQHSSYQGPQASQSHRHGVENPPLAANNSHSKDTPTSASRTSGRDSVDVAQVQMLTAKLSEKDKEIARLQEELKETREEAERLKNELQEQKKKEDEYQKQAEHKIQELLQDKNKMMDNISALMNQSLQRNQTDLENINEKVRPMVIMETYSNFCSQEWLEAKEVLDKLQGEDGSEMQACQFLTELMDANYAHAKKLLDTVERHFADVLTCPLTETVVKDMPVFLEALRTEGPMLRGQVKQGTISVDFHVCIVKVLRGCSENIDFQNASKGILESFLQTSTFLNHKIELLNATPLQDFNRYFMRLSWQMVLQQPPMHIVSKLSPGEKFEEIRHEPHFSSANPKNPRAVLHYYVHPALFHGSKQMLKGRVILRMDESQSKHQPMDTAPPAAATHHTASTVSNALRESSTGAKPKHPTADETKRAKKQAKKD